MNKLKNMYLKCYKLLLLVLFFNIINLKSKEILHFITAASYSKYSDEFMKKDNIDSVIGKFWIEYIPVYCNDCSFEDYELLVNNRIKINCTAHDLYLNYLELLNYYQLNKKKASIIFLYKGLEVTHHECFDKFKNEVLLKYNVKKVFLEIDVNIIDEDMFLSDISMFLSKIKNENIEIGIILNGLKESSEIEIILNGLKENNEKNYYILKTINRIINNNERIMALDYIYIKYTLTGLSEIDETFYFKSFVKNLLDNFDDISSRNLKEKIGHIFLIDYSKSNLIYIEKVTRDLISFGINNFGIMTKYHDVHYFLSGIEYLDNKNISYLEQIHWAMYNKRI